MAANSDVFKKEGQKEAKYRVFFYILHCDELCSARKTMCDKLEGILSKSSNFAATVEYITNDNPVDIMAAGRARGGGLPPGLVDINPDAVREFADLAPLHTALHVNQLSCALKHATALHKVCANAGQHGGFHVVLEDDALFGDEENLCKRLHEVLWNLPSDYDIVFMGLPTPNLPDDAADDAASLFVRVDKKRVFQRLSMPPSVQMPLLPCCDSYVVNPNAAARMLPLAKPVRFAAHLQLTWLIRKVPLNVYTSMPNIFVDGSKVGVYVSQLDPNNRLLWNDQFVKLEALVNSADILDMAKDPARLKATQEFVDGLAFKGHPDILRLLGRLQVRLGNFQEASVIFEQVFKMLSSERCVVNSQSTTLRDYMNLYRQLQDLPKVV